MWRASALCLLMTTENGDTSTANLILSVCRCIARVPRPQDREQHIRKGRGIERGARERKREVCLCPKGLFSVCVNEEVRMWQQERQTSPQCVCMGLCVCMWARTPVCGPCWTEVPCMWRSQLQASATRDGAWNHWNARDNCAACVGWLGVSLSGHLMEINSTFRVKVKMLLSRPLSLWDRKRVALFPPNPNMHTVPLCDIKSQMNVGHSCKLPVCFPRQPLSSLVYHPLTVASLVSLRPQFPLWWGVSHKELSLADQESICSCDQAAHMCRCSNSHIVMPVFAAKAVHAPTPMRRVTWPDVCSDSSTESPFLPYPSLTDDTRHIFMAC